MKMYTIEELKEIMERELQEARAKIQREFDKTLGNEKGCKSSEDIYHALLVLGGAEGFKQKILYELKKGEEKRAEDNCICMCDRCCYQDICEANYEVCDRFLAKF